MLQNPFQYSISELSSLLSESFIEFGQSGRVWHKNDVIQSIKESQSHDDYEITMFNERFQYSDNNVILLMYQVQKLNRLTQGVQQSLRSSLWEKNEEHWVMIFHQGTPTEMTR